MRDLYDRAAAGMLAVVDAISDSQLDEATPCAEFDVHALLNHLFHVAVETRKGMLGEHPDLVGEPADYVGADSDWRQRYAEAVEGVAAVCAAPDAAEGEPVLGIPRSTAVYMPLTDLVVHAWDLARATGQKYTPHPDVVAALYGVVQAMAPQARELGAFGAEVELPADAAEFDQLLAMTGRDPKWTA